VKENLKHKVDLMKEDVKEDLGRIRKWWTEQHLAVDFLKKVSDSSNNYTRLVSNKISYCHSLVRRSGSKSEA